MTLEAPSAEPLRTTDRDGKMLSRDDYAALLEEILIELSGIMARDGDRLATTSVPVRTEIDEALKQLRDPGTRRGQVAAISFGLSDELIRSNWDAVVDELYAAYSGREAASAGGGAKE